jgi:FkbH-like protein
LDLDGTLWGGIVGEVGSDGIHLGPAAPGIEFVEFQRALLNLTRRGIILALCSKNNMDDAMAVIRHHKYMVLREEHFGSMRINWKNKADNIRDIARELNIGLDSIVFIDDNPTERELVRQLLPEVLTVEMPKDFSRYRSTLESLSDFELLAVTREDEMRAAQYQASGKRQATRSMAKSLGEYLCSLNIKVEIELADTKHLSRLVQLFNKTNQFNLTTRRYQAGDVDNFLKSKNARMYTLSVQDRFGDHGLVGIALIFLDGQTWKIDSFLMSCRVMGLSVETAFLAKICDDALGEDIQTLVGEYLPTSKNHPVKEFYATHRFNLDRDDDGHQFWKLNLDDGAIKKPEWISISYENAQL